MINSQAGPKPLPALTVQNVRRMDCGAHAHMCVFMRTLTRFRCERGRLDSVCTRTCSVSVLRFAPGKNRCWVAPALLGKSEQPGARNSSGYAR